MRDCLTWCVVIFLAVLLVGGISLLLGLAVMTLWNFIVPEVLNGPTISFVEAWAMWLLLSVLLSWFTKGK